MEKRKTILAAAVAGLMAAGPVMTRATFVYAADDAAKSADSKDSCGGKDGCKGMKEEGKEHKKGECEKCKGHKKGECKKCKKHKDGECEECKHAREKKHADENHEHHDGAEKAAPKAE